MNKKKIISSIKDLSDEEVAKLIHNGDITLAELEHLGSPDFGMMRVWKVTKLLENHQFEEPTVPDMVPQNDGEKESPNEEEVAQPPIEEPRQQAPSPELQGQSRPRMFRNPFSFKGRIRRLEYGLSVLISYFISSVMSVYEMYNSGMDWLLGVNIFLLWFDLAQGTKRCHDIGHSGWWQLIPLYGFWMLFAQGDSCWDNEYGQRTK